VETPDDVGKRGKKDPEQLMHAISSGRIFLTRNHEDFELLHELVLLSGGHHPGVLAARSDNDPTRDMKPSAISRALRNLEAAGVPIADEYHTLNHWR
jgi:hypothetical protein